MLHAQALPLHPEKLPDEWDYSKELERVIRANGETPSDRLARLQQAEEMEKQIEEWRARVIALAEHFDLLVPEAASMMPFTPRTNDTGPRVTTPILRCPA